MLLPILAVLSQMHYEGDVPVAGGDYQEVAFEVPAGTVEIQIAHSDGSDYDILDWGVWSPEGFRGWGGGLTDDAIIGTLVSSRGYVHGAITPGTWTVVIGKAKLDDGGHYTIDVTCRDAATLTGPVLGGATENVLRREPRWYAGDFHVHSAQSGDASGTLDEIATFAKERGLDFVTISDHNTTAQFPLIADYMKDHRDVLLLPGAEVTTYNGHGNAIGPTTYLDHRIGFEGRTIHDVLVEVEAQHGIFIVNHPALALGDACIGCAWTYAGVDWRKVAGIEVLTGKWEVTVGLATPGAIAMWDAALDLGVRIAAIGGSDDHRHGQGTGGTDSRIGSPTTLVYARELSEAGIATAVREGRTIVKLRGPEDPDVTFTLDGAQIGDVVDSGDDPRPTTATLSIGVQRGAGTFAQVWRDGVKLTQLPVPTDDEVLTFVDAIEGFHRYRVELINDFNQRIVITSHIWTTMGADEGCGCASSRPGAGLALAGLVAVVLRRRRSPRRG